MPSFSALRSSAGAESPAPQRSASSVGGDDLRLLVLERGLDRPREAQDLVAGAARAVEQAADRLELEAVRLQLADQLDPRLVVGAVEAGAPADLRGGQQAARLVGADVANRHPGPPSELVDRQLFGCRLRHRLHESTPAHGASADVTWTLGDPVRRAGPPGAAAGRREAGPAPARAARRCPRAGSRSTRRARAPAAPRRSRRHASAIRAPISSSASPWTSIRPPSSTIAEPWLSIDSPRVSARSSCVCITSIRASRSSRRAGNSRAMLAIAPRSSAARRASRAGSSNGNVSALKAPPA